MKKKQKVISLKNLPFRLPISGTLAWWLFMDRIQAPQWAWTVVIMLGLVGWSVAIMGLLNSTQVDLKELE